jgi:hypothetical protein
LARAQWLDDCRSELLDTQYFHVIFTVPQPIATIALQNKDVVYNILFRATSETLRTIAADPKHLGAQIGFFAVLHTWDRLPLPAPKIEIKKDYRDRYEQVTGVSLKTCPQCHHDTMIIIERFECAPCRAPRIDTS